MNVEKAAVRSEHEEELTGGNTAESVVRLGSTVRKPAEPSTSAVHSLLAHLRASGFQAAPEAFGLDEQGRQVLEYVPGPLWHDSRTHTQTDLRRVGAIIRALHEAAISFHAPENAQWNTRYQVSRKDLICHNDLAPWNLVCGSDRWVFIDWDGAAPATRLWDLAWSSISFPSFEPGCNLEKAAGAMYALLEGYDLNIASYGELIRLMVTRAAAENDLIVEGATRGEQPWTRLYGEGHHRYWGPFADYIDRYASALETMMLSLREQRLRSP